VTATINLYKSFSFRWMRCHILIFLSVNVACYVYVWWWVSWRVFFFFPSLNFCSTNTIIISKSFRYLRFWWSKKRNWEPTTESDNEAWVYQEHNGANHQLFCIFFFFSTIKWRLNRHHRHRLFKKMMRHHRHYCQKSDQIMCVNSVPLCS
jgi:hypothetical protein